jgi:hypothetical protein
MTFDPKGRSAQEEALRRLLAEAVEPVEPGPGAEARLRARVRAQEDNRGRARPRRQRMFGWGATALASVAVVLVAVVLVSVVLLVNGGGRSSSSDSASSAGAATSPLSTPAAPTAAAQEAGGGTGQPGGAHLSLPYSASGRVTPLQFTATPTPALSLPDVPGAPSVQLPPTGRGAGIRAITQLPALGGGTVAVAVVRLTVDPDPVDVLVSLAGDRLMLLQRNGGPLELRVGATSGYACTPNGLALAGQRAPYVVDGNQLVPSPDLVAVAARTDEAAC